MTLKIIFLINGLGTGGAERSLAEMLPYFVQSGIHPIVVCFYRRTEGVEQSILSQGFDVHFLTDKPNLPSRVQALRKIINAEKAELLHTTLFEANLVGRLAAVGSPTRVISSLVNTSYDRVRLQDPNIKVAKLRMAQILDSVTARYLTNHFHAITQAVANAAIEALMISPSKITVIERGRNPDQLGWPSKKRRQVARQKLGFQDSDEIIINVARQEFQKGQRYLIEAMANLAETRPNLKLLIAGRQGNATAELNQLHTQVGLNGRIRFLGHRDDIPDILTAADLFVFPSLYEGLGVALIEAMALGLPIVATNIPAIQEVVEENSNAILVRPTETYALQKAIDSLISDPKLRLTYSKCSRKIFEQKFTLQRSASRMVNLFQQVASN